MSDKKRPVLVLIHGFRGTNEGLALIAQHLTAFDCRIPDLPGFGNGESREEYTLDSYVEWLHDYIAKIGEPVHLLGHSFGSIICANYARTYPKTLLSLSLVNPIGAPALEGPRAALSKLAVAYYWLGKTLPERAGKAWLSSKPSVMVMSTVMAKTKHKPTRAFIHAQHLEHFSRFHSAQSVYQGFITSISHSVRDDAEHITTPTLLIAGSEDDITPVLKQIELVKLFPRARLEVIDGVGHLTHYETPDIVAASVQAFIKSV